MPLDSDFLVSLKINGVDFGNWDQKTGGGFDATEIKYTPFDGVERTYVSKRTKGNVTLARDYRPARDGAILKAAESLQDQPAVVTVLDKDKDGNTQANQVPKNGFVKAIIEPDSDSDGSSVAKISIEISVGTRD